MKVRGVVTVGFAIIAIVISIHLIVVRWQINRDINGWKTRAQVSSEPNDMHEYMTNVKEGMESWGMTRGYSVLIFQTPDNDMALIYRTVCQQVDQAKVLTAIDRSTPEYQTGLDILRGSIRELELHAQHYWGVHQGLVFWVLIVVDLIAFIVAWLFWLDHDPYL